MLEQMEAYLAYLQAERAASPHTLKNYAIDLQQFRAFLRARKLARSKPVMSGVERGDVWERDIDPAEIDSLTIRAFIADLHGRGMSRSTIARKLACLRSFFRYLCREGVLQANPAKLVSTPKLPKRLPAPFSVDEHDRP